MMTRTAPHNIELISALKPFADAAAVFSHPMVEGDAYRLMPGLELTVGDLKRARAAHADAIQVADVQADADPFVGANELFAFASFVARMAMDGEQDPASDDGSKFEQDGDDAVAILKNLIATARDAVAKVASPR